MNLLLQERCVAHSAASIIFFGTILLQLTASVNGSSNLGRATYYGAGDGFTLNDGSCACHKRWGWLSNRCESGHCFDYIGEWSSAASNCPETERNWLFALMALIASLPACTCVHSMHGCKYSVMHAWLAHASMSTFYITIHAM